MKVIDLSNRRKERTELPNVLENEFFKLELKDGRKIESASLCMSVEGIEHGVAVSFGTGSDIVDRTVEALLNLGTSVLSTDPDADSDFVKGLMCAVCETAIDIFDNSVAQVEKDEENNEIKVRVGLEQ